MIVSVWVCGHCGARQGREHRRTCYMVTKYGKHTPAMAGSGQVKQCAQCGLYPTPEGHDGCLGALLGPIMNACCGHGRNSGAYIQYWNKKDIRGEKAIIEQRRLLKQSVKTRDRGGDTR